MNESEWMEGIFCILVIKHMHIQTTYSALIGQAIYIHLIIRVIGTVHTYFAYITYCSENNTQCIYLCGIY